MGLLDAFEDPGVQLGLGLLAAGGPSAVPMSPGQRIAGAFNQFRQQRVADEERKLMQDFRQAQMRQLQETELEKRRQREAAGQLESYLMQQDPSGRLVAAFRMDPKAVAGQLIPARPKMGDVSPDKFEPASIAEFYRTNDFSVLKPIAPKAQPTELERLQALRASLPPGDPRLQEVNDAIRKATQFAPPQSTTISLQGPVPIQLPDGSVGYAQPANRPGAAPQIMQVEGKPLVRPPAGDGKQPAEIQRMTIAATTMKNLLDEYDKFLQKNNPRDPLVQMNPTLRADITSLSRNIQLQFKELQALGALAGPDLAIMESAISDPFSGRGAFYGSSGLRAQIARARQLIDERTKAMGGQPASKPAEANPDPLGLRGN